MQNPIGCVLFLVIGILFPFVGGTIMAFAIGGWKLGVGTIIYTAAALWICSKVKERSGFAYFLLMIPLYILQLYGLSRGRFLPIRRLKDEQYYLSEMSSAD